MIDLAALPQEIRDKIELREQMDQTFHRFCEENYTEIFFNTVAERANPDVEHSLILSVSGQQGSGKCFSKDTKILSNKGVVEGQELEIGDEVFDKEGEKVKILNKWESKKECVKLVNKFSEDVVVSKEHRMLTQRGFVQAKDLVKGDLLRISAPKVKTKGSKKDYAKGFVYGAYLADGSISVLQKMCLAKRTKGVRKNGIRRQLLISNNDVVFLNKVNEFFEEGFAVKGKVYSVSEKRNVLCVSSIVVEDFLKNCGKVDNKVVPVDVFDSEEFLQGFLEGFCSGDMTCNYGVSKKNTAQFEVGWTIKQKSLALGFVDALHSKGIWPVVSVRTLRSGKYEGKKYYRLSIPTKYIEDFFSKIQVVNSNKLKKIKELLDFRNCRKVGNSYNTVKGNSVITNDVSINLQDDEKFVRLERIENIGVKECIDVEVSGNHVFQFAGGLVTHNSMSAIAIAKVLNPAFDERDIYFDYNQLVYNRDKLRPNSVVLVDEQQQSYGLDSHRVMTILSSLKEQLRKKSIHFIFCSPVLYSEAKSSMYVLEVIFIDYETQEAYAALKTREELTLGHVRIPYPLKDLGNGYSLATQELLDKYEQKKDEHLDKVLGNQNTDVFEERAAAVMENDLFKRAEKLYVDKRGFIPQTTLVQIINKIYPEFHAGVVPIEIAGRIKFHKELNGEWEVAGSSKKTAKTAKKKKSAKKKK